MVALLFDLGGRQGARRDHPLCGLGSPQQRCMPVKSTQPSRREQDRGTGDVVRSFQPAEGMLVALSLPLPLSCSTRDRAQFSNSLPREVERNLRERLPASAGVQWQSLRPALAVVKDELTFPWPVVFPAAKDRPVLFTAAATAEVLLTLDRSDFGALMESGFYGMAVMKPGDFLLRERKAGRLK